MSGDAKRDTPRLDDREPETIVRELVTRAPAFVPGWQPGERGPGAAVVQVYARYIRALGDRIDAAPDKNKLAFFDMLGLELLGAQAARAPVVFRALPAVGDSRVPERTRVGANVPGRDEPLVFETDEAIALASARLAEVVTLWPGRDAFADHTAALLRGDTVTLFEQLVPVAHELYLAHDVHFALAGRSIVELSLELATVGAEPLDIVWEYWDGELWRGFKSFKSNAANTPSESFDGTQGLTRSGVVRLVSDCATAAPATIDGVSARWIRARLAGPLAPASGQELPALERIAMRTVIDRSLPTDACAFLGPQAGIQPDAAYANEQKLDLTKAVQPLGAHPQAGGAMYLNLAEAMAKPGAEVQLCFRRVITAEEVADQAGADFTFDVATAQGIVVAAAQAAADAILQAAQSVREVATLFFNDSTLNFYRTAVTNARNALGTQGIDGVAALDQAAQDLISFVNGITVDLELPGGTIWNFVVDPFGITSTAILNDFVSYRTHNQARLTQAITHARNSAQQSRAALNQLEDLTPFSTAMAAGATLPFMDTPVVAWEYWNGRHWALLNVQGTAEARTFRADGPVRFTVPDDAEETKVSGTAARWVRARLVRGGYGIVNTVSWKDQHSGKLNFFPIVIVRPPTLDGVRYGYMYRSPLASPERCRALNDFRFANHDEAARTIGTPFDPFVPVADRTPALYLGFDRPLPADRIGLFFDVEEKLDDPEGPPLAWEYWDGTGWLPLQVRDESGALARPGHVAALWPGVPSLPSAAVGQAAGDTVQLDDMTAASRFAPGDLLWIEQNGAGELVTLRSTQGNTLTLIQPLARAYGRGTIGIAALPRFGTPRWWMRARLKADRAPRRSRLAGLHLNAVWASQVQTFDQETLGSSNGEPDQVFFFRNLPVLEDEVVEVRELSGPRARVEEPMLREELARAGVPAEDIRVTRDQRSGHVTEVWVRWREQPNLFFSSPTARHYLLERTRGRLRFGGSGLGMIPPAGTDNIRVRMYRAGGGTVGNVSRGAITRVLAGVLAESVTNPRPAEGGADGEPIERVLNRGGSTIRHRRQAITAGDFEALALEASPAVAVARVLPATHPSGRSAPGWVTVIVVPWSDEARPVPSYELRSRVRRFLARRAPAAVASQIAVVTPTYLPIGVQGIIKPADPAQAGPTLAAIKVALARFLHPLIGGPNGTGWRFGRDVHLSDVAAVVEGVAGVDYAASLTLLVDGTPVGDRAVVPDDRIVVAGALQITLAGEEG